MTKHKVDGTIYKKVLAFITARTQAIAGGSLDKYVKLADIVDHVTGAKTGVQWRVNYEAVGKVLQSLRQEHKIKKMPGVRWKAVT